MPIEKHDPYTALVVDEPVRGHLPDPSFYSLPGIEQARAWVRGDAPTVPLSHLMGFRLTQIGTGNATATQPATPALQSSHDGAVEGLTLMLETMTLAVLTGAPPASSVRAAAFAVDHLRPSTLESETLVAKARTLHSGRTFTLAEVALEDSAGRGVAHGKATFVIRPIEPPPPPWAGFAGPPDTPVYATPDPYLREVPGGASMVDDEATGLALLTQIAAGERRLPSYTLLGMRFVDVSEGTLSVSLRASEWLCCLSREVSPGVIAYLAHSAHGAVLTLMPAGHRFGSLNQSVSFLRPVAPDGGELLARGTVTHRGDEFLISHVEVTDDAGKTVAVGTQTSLFIRRQPRQSSGTQPLRMLATVLFTDIVGFHGTGRGPRRRPLA